MNYKTLEEALKNHSYFYKIHWPDGTDSYSTRDPNFAEQYAKYSKYHTFVDREDDYDERGNNFGVTRIYVG